MPGARLLTTYDSTKKQDNSNYKSIIQTAPSSLFYPAFLKKKQAITHFYSFNITHNLCAFAFTYYSLHNLRINCTLREIMFTIDIGPCECQSILSFHSTFRTLCYYRSHVRRSIRATIYLLINIKCFL